MVGHLLVMAPQCRLLHICRSGRDTTVSTNWSHEGFTFSLQKGPHFGQNSRPVESDPYVGQTAVQWLFWLLSFLSFVSFAVALSRHKTPRLEKEQATAGSALSSSAVLCSTCLGENQQLALFRSNKLYIVFLGAFKVIKKCVSLVVFADKVPIRASYRSPPSQNYAKKKSKPASPLPSM